MALAVVFHVPSAEYVIGGRDPGVYLNEGIQIAQRGSLIVDDPLVASIPEAYHRLFFPIGGSPTRHGSRFMSFFIVDPDKGYVVGQFPHLYPVWVAIGVRPRRSLRSATGRWRVGSSQRACRVFFRG